MVEVYDNVLEESQFSNLENFLMGSEFTWHFGDFNFKKENPLLYTWQHQMWSKRYSYRSHALSVVEPYIITALKNSNQHFTELLRIRAVCNTATEKSYSTNPHVDMHLPHKTALLYINDSEGPTKIFQEYALITDPKYVPENLTIESNIFPKRNRLIWFNGLQFHSATTPVNNARRVLLNINYK